MRITALLLLILTGCSINTVGQSFVGTKYMNSPLGEGIAPDADPLIRFDAFDCTTFVETVLANGEEKKLNKIRYQDGKIDFLNRNHFIESDWLVNNSDIVHNVSNKFAQTKVRTVTIDKQNWFKTVHNISTDFAPETIHLEYIPYQNIKKINNDTPLIVLFISDNPKIHDKIGTDLAVVHMGFLLPDGTLRHASSEQNMVIDVNFYDYIRDRQKTKHNIGITLVAIK